MRCLHLSLSPFHLVTCTPVKTIRSLFFADSSLYVYNSTKFVPFRFYSSDVAQLTPPFLYGSLSFSEIRECNGFYVDKTRFIRYLHEKKFRTAMLHRPPRFGKSLFLSTLEAYYDNAISPEKRDELFKGLHISRNPVPGAGEYYIFHLDLSVDVDVDVETLKNNLHDKINDSVLFFAEKYKIPTSDKREAGCIHINSTNSMSSFESLCNFLRLSSKPLFVLIDEYDRFANKLLFEDPEAYKSVVAGQSGKRGSSFIRTLFETLKSQSMRFKLEDRNFPAYRIFAVGLCPLALSDASGANVFTDISHLPKYADIVGFKQKNIEDALELVAKAGKTTSEQVPVLLDLMKNYYNGYKFHFEQDERLYNPTLCIRFLSNLWDVSVEKLLPLAYPDYYQNILSISEGALQIDPLLADENVKISANIFDFLAHNRLTSGIICQFQEGPLLPFGGILSTFTMPDLLAQISGLSERSLLSLMYYHGMVTYGDLDTSPGSLQIPNYLARVQFLDRMARMLQEHLSRFLRTFDPTDLKTSVQKQLSMMGPMDGNFNESTLKAFTLSILKGHRINVKGDMHIVKNDPYSDRIDVSFTTDEGQAVFMELKTVMPHNLVTFKGKKGSTHFWPIDDKNNVHRILMEMSPAEIAALKYEYDTTKKEKSTDTLSELFESGHQQLRKYGKAWIEKRREENALHLIKKPPLLFFVSSVWNLHLAVEKIEIENTHTENEKV